MNAYGKRDTTWNVIAWADTFNLMNSAKIMLATSSTTMDSTGAETFSKGMIDTTNVAGFGVLTIPITPIWSPLVRPVVKGLIGNRTVGWIRVLCGLSQRMYVPTRNK
jgi:hypothetical protein